MDSTDGKVITLYLQCLKGLKPVVWPNTGVLAEEGLWLVRDMVLEEGNVENPVILCEAGADLVDALVLLVLQLVAGEEKVAILSSPLARPV